MMQEKISRLAQWRQGIPVGPITLELNPTNKCNLSCQSCWQREFEFNPKDALSTERMISLIQEAAALGVKEVRIPGAGEPLLRTDLLNVMAEIKKHKMHGLLITNGTVWTEEKIRRTIEMNWDIVTFSIDGPTAEVHDALRGKPGSFEKIIRALRMFQSVKNETGHSLPVVRFTLVLSNQNYALLPEMVEFAREYGCEDFQVQPMTVWGKTGKNLALSAEQRDALPHYVNPALKSAQQYAIHTNIGSFLGSSIVENASETMHELISEQTSHVDDNFVGLPCFEPFYNMVILPDGTASFCSIAGGRGGESVVNRNLRDVWLGSAYQDIRRTLMDKTLKDYCKRCCSAVNLESDRLRQGLQKQEGGKQ